MLRSLIRSLTRALASARPSCILDTAHEPALALVTAGWRRIRMCTHHWIEGLAHITCWKLGLTLLNVGQQGFHILATFTIIFGFLTGPVALAHSSFFHLIRDRHLGMLHHCHLRDDIMFRSFTRALAGVMLRSFTRALAGVMLRSLIRSLTRALASARPSCILDTAHE